ncbi:DNA repair protein RecO [Neorhodopirellula pilleata]|uniref:DNA repair protein RecO n=1 Tax=Neorhodopirellula pilleata TaxID=2714738 RepID=A0A5C6AD98_9BACT|nr:DNA repair protein RecO [Neorhodopirellula pilleata]TWT96223.1 DNA repair protein RecO [Neorhodopirellula pilleata]
MNFASTHPPRYKSDGSHTHSTTAVVLRTVEFSETSLVVTLLTRDLGRVSALAKGARRLKGPFEGSLDLLSVCQIVLIAKSGDRLDLLTESKLRRRFRGGDRSLERTYAGYYIAETLRYWLDDDEPHQELFDLTLAALGLIDGEGPVAQTLLAYDCQCLRLLGHAPSTRRCTACDQLILPGRAKIPFSLDGGGVVCNRCRSTQSYLRLVRPATLEALETLVRPPQRIDENSVTFPLRSMLPPVDQTSYSELRGLISRYIQHLIGRELRMQPYLPTNIETFETTP